jgi:hypothetical protein
MYFDQVLIRRGRTVTRVFLTTFAHPFKQRFEASLVREIACRLATSLTVGGPTA